MAVESKIRTNLSEFNFDLEYEDSKLLEIPYTRVLRFSYESFRPDRVLKIKARISTLLDRMLICPDKKPAYIQEINKLILFEMGKR